MIYVGDEFRFQPVGGLGLLTAGLAVTPLLVKEKQRQGVTYEGDPILFYAAFIWSVYVVLLVLRWRFASC